MRGLAVFSLAAVLAAVVLGGAGSFGRLALAVGWPGMAEALFQTADWRGVAAYRAGDMDRAAKEFLQAEVWFNLGNAEAQQGHYAAALEAYDVAMATQPDPRARENFDIIARLYAGFALDPDSIAYFDKREGGTVEKAEVAQGNARASGTGDAVTNTNTMLGLAALDSHGQTGVRQIFDDAYMLADDRWLQQLRDVPGDYLRARIQHEHKRRKALGLTPPDPKDPR